MFKKIDPDYIGSIELQKIILASVAPRPIAFVSTIDGNASPNLAPFSYFNAFGVNPTTLIFSPARRGRDSSIKHSFENIREVPEVVINMVSYDMVQQTSLASNEFPKGVDEFVKAGFTPLSSETVRPFRVKESPVQYECHVRDVIETGPGGGAGNLVICEVRMIHLSHDVLDENNVPLPDKIRLVGRMGGNKYVKAFGESLFEVEKPGTLPGIGIDQLPDHIRLSHILTGNHLGMLGNCPALPDPADSARIKSHPEVIALLAKDRDNHPALEQELQLLGRKWLDEQRVQEAFALLMIDITHC